VRYNNYSSSTSSTSSKSLIIFFISNYVREIDYVSAAFALVRRKDFVRLNMFDGVTITIALVLVVLVVRVLL